MRSLGRPVLIVDWGQIGLAEDDLTNRLIDAISHISIFIWLDPISNAKILSMK